MQETLSESMSAICGQRICWNNIGAKVELSFKGVIHKSTVLIQFSASSAFHLR